jgi:uncharacterized protein YoxC
MVIVYLSLALVVVSLIGFAISVINSLKLMNGTIEKISKTGAKMQHQSEEIINEQNELTLNLTRIQSDITEKKSKVQDTVRQAKQSVLTVQVALCKGKALLKNQTD